MDAADFWPMGVPRDVGPLPPTLTEALRRSAARRPGHIALAFYGQEIDYRTLLARVERLAAFLQHRCGVRAGDRVLLAMQNSPHFVIGFHAVIRAGAVVVPVNPMNTTNEIAGLRDDSDAGVALLGAELLPRFAALPAGGLRHMVVAAYRDGLPDPPPFRVPPLVTETAAPATLPAHAVAWEAALAEPRAPLPDRTGPDDLCVMPYTSGTTGRPKACAHTHAGAVFNAAAQARWYGHDDGSVLTAFMPMFHVTGMQVSMNAGLAAGCTLVVMARWDRDLVPRLFRRYGVTFWSAAPTMIVDVLAAPTFDERAFDRLRVLTGGGAIMPGAVAAQLETRFGLRFIEGYGLSETLSATHINPLDRPKPQCLGIPVHATDARIVDPETLAPLPTGETGEIVIAGPQVMRGYWNRPDADAEAFFERDGKRFLRTGDLGRVDAEGYFFVVDRLKRMINVSGYKVWPAECEAMLYHHPAIQECCVIAAPDAYRGETVKVFVVRRAGAALDAPELIAWARGRMAAYKVPRLVAFVDALPRSASNKIDWRRLEEAERASATDRPEN
jgi:fatty-acyl-CoA synthase